MDNCCGSTMKILCLLFNFIFVLTAVAMIAMGAYINVEIGAYFDFLGDNYLSLSYIMIALGVVIFLVSFLGCCGSCLENLCMMKAFSGLLLIILVGEIAVATLVIVFKNDARMIVVGKMREGMNHFSNDSDDVYAGLSHTWNILQGDMRCCGVDGYLDWKNTTFSGAHDVPDSCCRSESEGCGKDVLDAPSPADIIYTAGCFSKLETFIVAHATLATGVGITIVVLQIIEILASCCLSKNIAMGNRSV